MQEINVFKQHTNVFDEYMFSYYYFSPMSRQQIERVMRNTLTEMYLTEEDLPNHDLDQQYLHEVFPDFFSMVSHMVANYTVTVNEYAYLCIFLYPHYMGPVYEE